MLVKSASTEASLDAFNDLDFEIRHVSGRLLERRSVRVVLADDAQAGYGVGFQFRAVRAEL